MIMVRRRIAAAILVAGAGVMAGPLSASATQLLCLNPQGQFVPCPSGTVPAGQSVLPTDTTVPRVITGLPTSPAANRTPSTSIAVMFPAVIGAATETSGALSGRSAPAVRKTAGKSNSALPSNRVLLTIGLLLVVALWIAVVASVRIAKGQRPQLRSARDKRSVTPQRVLSGDPVVRPSTSGQQVPPVGPLSGHRAQSAAKQVAVRPRVDTATTGLLLSLTDHYLDHALEPVVEALSTRRAVAVVGGAGTGKSTLASALRNPPKQSGVPVGLVDAAAFVSAATGVGELARRLAEQLAELPGFKQASTRFEKDNQSRWATLDGWIRQLAGPLSVYNQRVVVLIDGFDRVAGTVQEAPLRRALSQLLDAATMVNVVVLGRADPHIAGTSVVAMPDVTEETARSYLTSRGVDSADHERLLEMADGRWLVLDLAAEAAVHGRVSDERLYDDLLNRARDRAGGLVDRVIDLLAAAGTGHFLPIDVLRSALRERGDPIQLARLNQVLGDTDMYRVIERIGRGTAGDRLGLYHQSLTEYVMRRGDIRRERQAIVDAVERLAPASRHDPKKYRVDPALVYAATASDVAPRVGHGLTAKTIEAPATNPDVPFDLGSGGRRRSSLVEVSNALVLPAVASEALPAVRPLSPTVRRKPPNTSHLLGLPLLAVAVLGLIAWATSSIGNSGGGSGGGSGSTAATQGAYTLAPAGEAAAAAPDSESAISAYVNTLGVEGMTWGQSNEIALGQSVCSALESGTTADQVHLDLIETGQDTGNFAAYQAGILLGAAVQSFCPSYDSVVQNASTAAP